MPDMNDSFGLGTITWIFGMATQRWPILFHLIRVHGAYGVKWGIYNVIFITALNRLVSVLRSCHVFGIYQVVSALFDRQRMSSEEDCSDRKPQDWRLHVNSEEPTIKPSVERPRDD